MEERDGDEKFGRHNVWMINAVLYRYDPVALVQHGVPVDEYESEASMILADVHMEIPSNERTPENVGSIVQRIFEKRFGGVSIAAYWPGIASELIDLNLLIAPGERAEPPIFPVGHRVRLCKLQDRIFYGALGVVVGPGSGGRYPVKLLSAKAAAIARHPEGINVLSKNLDDAELFLPADRSAPYPWNG